MPIFLVSDLGDLLPTKSPVKNLTVYTVIGSQGDEAALHRIIEQSDEGKSKATVRTFGSRNVLPKDKAAQHVTTELQEPFCCLEILRATFCCGCLCPKSKKRNELEKLKVIE